MAIEVPVVLLQGLPGSGKGAQAEILAKSLGWVHVSCGEIFRQNIVQETEFGKLAALCIAQRVMTPDEATTEMFLSYLTGMARPVGLIVEGFPRTLGQALAFDDFLAQADMVVKAAIYLSAPLEKL